MGEARTQAPQVDGRDPAGAERSAAPAAASPSPARAFYPLHGLSLAGASAPDDVPLTRDNLLLLQRTVGNREVSRLLQRKAKPAASATARRGGAGGAGVRPAGMPAIRRKCACGGDAGAQSECEGCRAKRRPVQRHAEGAAAESLPASVSEVLGSGGGEPLPAMTRQYMEGALGTDLGGVRVHTGPGVARAAEDISAEAFTEGQDIYFGAGGYEPGSAGGQRLLAHELTHTVQQRGGGAGVARGGVSQPGDPQEVEAEAVAERVTRGDAVGQVSRSEGAVGRIHRYSWDEFTDDVSGTVDAVEGAAEAAGEAVVEGAEAVGEAASEALDWVEEQAGEVYETVGQGLHITLPDVTLFDRMEHTESYSDETDSIEIFSTVVEVPYIGPVVLTLYGRGEMLAAVVIGVGPGILRQISLTLDPLAGVYRGTAQLDVAANLTGSLTLDGILGGAANWACLLNVVRVEGGLGITGSAGLNTDFSQAVTLAYEDGEFSLDRHGSFTPCLNLGLDLDALANVIILDYPIWMGRWNLGRQTWSKCWPIPLGIEPGSGYQGGGGSSGGGGASGSWGDGESGGGGVTSSPAEGAAISEGATNEAGGNPFSAASLLRGMFGSAPPSMTMQALPTEIAAEVGKETNCPVTGDEAEQVRQEIREKLRSKYLRPGACAAGSIPASRSDTVLTAEQREVDKLGAAHGCHNCDEGARPGHWTGDHQPVTKLVQKAQQEPELMTLMTEEGLATTLAGQRLFPHSDAARLSQGGTVTAIFAKLKKLKRLKGTP